VIDQDATQRQLPSPEPETRSDSLARRGLVCAWSAFILGLIAWVVGLVAIIGFRNDPYVDMVLAPISLVFGFAAVVLAWIAKRRVRESNLLHAALDFISGFAWHIAWTSAMMSVVVGVVAWQARTDEIERIQEETFTN
jgi:hypothetical protein